MTTSIFSDRCQAGASLAAQLAALTPPPAAIGAIGPGGVVVAAPIAALLGIPLVPVHVQVLAAPPAPGVAFGAVDDEGRAVFDYPLIAALRIDSEDVERIKDGALSELRARRRGQHARLADWLPAERVVLVAEGLASGLRMDAIVAQARRHGAQDVVVAVPCASPQAAARLRGSADRLVVLVVDPCVESVAACYASFPEVGDEELARAVSRLGGRPLRSRGAGPGGDATAPSGS